MNRNFLLLLISLVFIGSCKKVKNESLVYSNDFESNNLAQITNGNINQFNNTAVLGQYSGGGFTLQVDNLPKHDLVTVSFDLYIHDNWRGYLAPDGPAIWQMLVDNSPYINATFSNLGCVPGYICPPQSYPNDYPNTHNNPKTGAYRTDLPGVCSLKNDPNGTTLYKITKTFRHSNSNLVLQCLDKLDQKDYADPKCEKSWSVDNINIKAITL